MPISEYILQLLTITDGCDVVAQCRFHRGRLTLAHFESVEDNDNPLPEVRIPERKAEIINPNDGSLADLAKLDKDAAEAGYGKLAHSIYRMKIPMHVVFATKYRKTCLVGSEMMAQAVLRQVCEQEGLEVVACAVEQHSGTHAHLILRHSGPGGTPPTFVWSKTIGRIKALASHKMANLDPEQFPGWRDGYSISAIGNGQQAAEQALAMVKAYVEAQGVQSSEIGSDPRDEAG